MVRLTWPAAAAAAAAAAALLLLCCCAQVWQDGGNDCGCMEAEDMTVDGSGGEEVRRTASGFTTASVGDEGAGDDVRMRGKGAAGENDSGCNSTAVVGRAAAEAGGGGEGGCGGRKEGAGKE